MTELLTDRAWDELRRLVRENLDTTDDPVPLALAAALLDVDQRLRVLEKTPPGQTRIEVIQNFENADPERVAKAFIDALERGRTPV